MSDYIEKYHRIIRRISVNPFVTRLSSVFHYLVHQSRFSLYLRTLFNTAMEAVILLVAVYALSLTLLYLAEMMWWVYQHTPVGSRFLVEFGDRAHAINTIMALEFWRFAGKITVSAFIICTGVSAISWFFPIGRNFYDPMGFWAKLMFWGLPLSAAVSFYISEALDFSSIEIMLVFTVVPTMCLFMSCFNYTERLVPEMGDIISEGCRFAKECTAFIKDKIEKG